MGARVGGLHVRTNLFLAVLLLSGVGWVRPSAAIQTNGSVTVRVLDAQGGRVADARLALFTRDNRVRFTALTDASGEYRFERVAPGEYLAHAEAPGFSRSVAQSVVVGQGVPVSLDLELQLAAVQEQVVVTASGTAQTVDEVSKAITVVENTEIDIRDEFSIPEVLRTVPGVRVQTLGGPGAFSSIKIRGLRTEDTAVLLDGFRLRDAASTQGDVSGLLEGLIVTDLDRIEILRGSGSSLYGTNAVGGVVNVVTAEGGGRPQGNVLLEGGSLGFFRGRAQIAGGFEGDRLTYSLGLARLDVSEGVDGDDESTNTSAQGQIRFRPTSSSTLSARIYTADAFLKINETPQSVGAIPPTGVIGAEPLSSSQLALFEAGVPASDLDVGTANFIPSANDPDNTRDTRFMSAAVSFEQRPSERFGYSLAYHGLVSERTFQDGPLGVGFEPAASTTSEFDGDVHTLYASADLQLGDHHLLTAGYELEKEIYFNASFPENPADNSVVDVSQSSNTLFVQDQLSLQDGLLQISGAFRAQFFTLGDPVFTPEENAPYRGVQLEDPPSAFTGDGSVAYFFPQSGTKLRAHLGNGYRAPSLFERFGTFFDAFGYSISGDPRLEPERSLGFDLGVDQRVFGQRMSVSGTFFHTRLQRVIVFDFTGAIDPVTDPFGRFGGYRNVDGGSSRGLELGLTTTATETLQIGVAYTYTDAEPPSEGDPALTQAYVIPAHQFSLVATQHVGRDFYVNFVLAASDSYFAPVFDPITFVSRTFRFGGIVKADLGASYTWRLDGPRGIRLFGKVQNLFDRENLESGFRTGGRSAVGGAAFEF